MLVSKRVCALNNREQARHGQGSVSAGVSQARAKGEESARALNRYGGGLAVLFLGCSWSSLEAWSIQGRLAGGDVFRAALGVGQRRKRR
jgi:hypothetical protein